MIPRHRFVSATPCIALFFAASPVWMTTWAGGKVGVDVPSEVRVTSPSGAETAAVAICPVDTQKLVAGTNGPNGGQRLHYSHDGGSTWTQASFSLEDWPHGGSPTLEWSSDGQFAYTVLTGGCGEGCFIVFYRSDDDGVTWTSLETESPGNPRREIAFGTGGEYRLHVDRYETSKHKDNIYVAYNEFPGDVMQLGRSRDFGDRWSDYSFSQAPPGRGGVVTTDRAGDVYYAWLGTPTQEIYVSKSTNGGASFGDAVTVASRNVIGAFAIPIVTYDGVSDYLVADADTGNGPYADSLYLVWTDSNGLRSPVPEENHGRIQVAYSRDGGATWTVTTPHETSDQLTVDRWQPYLAVGENGVVHVIFNDTRHSGDRLSMDVFYSFSTDGAQTWSVPERVTSEMSPEIDHWREFGGYSGLDIVMDDLVAVFTDNRHEEGGTGDSVDIYAADIPPGGSSIGAGWIPGGRGIAGPPLMLARLETGELQLDWSPVCGAGDDYAVYEGAIGFFDEKNLARCTTGGATTTILAPSAGNVFYLVVATRDGSAEGSYGMRSDHSQRSPAQAACFPQILGSCP